jgi:hypothetical protein
MVAKERTGAAENSAPPSAVWQERTDAALALQKSLLESYAEANRAWLERVQSEVALWSDLATKLTATRSVPEAFEAYSKCVSQRLQMAADDGRRLADEAREISKKLAGTLGNGWPTVKRN